MIVFVGFIAAFVASFGGFFMFKPMEVDAPLLAAVATLTPTPTSEPLAEPSPTPSETPVEIQTPEPSQSPSLKPTATQTPTPRPTPTSTPTPQPLAPVIPTITPAPSPQVLAATVNPTATPDVWSPPSMESLFAQYAGVYGVDKNALERIANCESHFNPNAKNGDYLGMFQFSTTTWIANRNLLGMDSNPALRTNVEESIRTAAFLLSKRGTSPWPSCI